MLFDMYIGYIEKPAAILGEEKGVTTQCNDRLLQLNSVQFG